MIYLVLLTIIELVLMGVVGIRLRRALVSYKIKKNYTAALEAPSVSVCIPARNETHAMAQCLERVLASDYRKLEIIVFDDSSSDDTSILVRSFAHAGVRFVPGVELPEGWLGRNHALEVLAREASGTYVLFMDVDTNIQPATINQLVGHMMTENLVMTSVLPGRSDTWRASTLFGHLRYFWELILSRANAPAASSALWMINRHVLLDTLGGFTPHKNEVLPEEHIAAIIGPVGYHCLISNHTLGATYEKKWRSQVETSRRLLFPMMGGMWYGALAGVSILLLLNAPLILVIVGLAASAPALLAVGSVFVLSGMVTYGLYLRKIWPDRWWLGGLLWPYVILQELGLFIVSVWGYSRGTITWKGRPVTASPIRVDHLEIDI
jgi:glycosyltransferase involved in cell wall biosynthesis